MWVVATYLLEGRIHSFQSADPIARITYVTVANIAIGTVLTAIAIRHLVRTGLVNPSRLGLKKSWPRAASIIGAAYIGGLAIFILQNPQTLEPQVVLNVFMQVMPVSIAEVMVCWGLIGSSFESLIKRNRVASVLLGAVITSVLFGVYHYAHSPPFNQTSMVMFLMLPSIATALTYFLGRNIYAAIIVQNFMGVFGVLASLPTLEPYRQPMVPIYVLSAVSIAAVVISISVILQRTAKKQEMAVKKVSRSSDEKEDSHSEGNIAE